MDTRRQTIDTESTRPRRNASTMDVTTTGSREAPNVDATPVCSNTVPPDTRQEAQAHVGTTAAADVPPLPLYSCLSAQNHMFSLQLCPEVYRKSSNAADPFYRRTTQEALRFYDDYLPEDPVHILRLGQDALLRVRLTQDAASPFTIQRILALSVRVTDEEVVALQMHTEQNETIEAVGLLRPSDFATDGRLNRISPSCGMLDRKYVRLAVQIRIQLSAPFQGEVNLLKCIYVKIVHPRSKLRLQRWLKMFENQDQYDLHDQPRTKDRRQGDRPKKAQDQRIHKTERLLPIRSFNLWKRAATYP